MFLQVLTQDELPLFYTEENGTVKLGQTVQTLDGGVFSLESLKKSVKCGARFAVLGIPEIFTSEEESSINDASACWKSFLKMFLNQHSNCFLDGREILILGTAASESVKDDSESEAPLKDLMRCRLDEFIFPIISVLRGAGLIPIIAGADHDNSFSVIKGSAFGLSLNNLSEREFSENEIVKSAFGIKDSETAEEREDKLEKLELRIKKGIQRQPSEMSLAEAVRMHLQKEAEDEKYQAKFGLKDVFNRRFFPLSVVNCDIKGRFGALDDNVDNAISCAKAEGYLSNYCLVNYFENENSADMLSYMRQQDARAFSYESMFVRREVSYEDTLNFAVNLMASTDQNIGLEFDLNCAENLLYQGLMPGLSAADCAYFVHLMAASLPVCYFYIAGASVSAGCRTAEIGRISAVLASTFIKAVCSRMCQAV